MRSWLGTVLLTAATAGLAACSSGSSGGGSSSNTPALMAGFDPGPAPAASAGFQVITPILKDLKPAASQEYCTWSKVVEKEGVWLNASEGFQTEGGHHIIVFYTTNPQPPTTALCTNDEMAEFKFAMPTDRPSTGGSVGTKTVLPGDLAVYVPAGAQIVVNHHYLNASGTTIPEVQSAINVYYAPATSHHTPSANTVVLNSSMVVPVGSSALTINCTVKDTFALWQMLPHMHQWGTHVTVTDTPVATGEPKQLFDLDWDADYAFDLSAVATTPGPNAPFMLNPGDKLSVECDYLNTTGAPLDFGQEMCVFFGMTVDSHNLGDLACDDGSWGPY